MMGREGAIVSQQACDSLLCEGRNKLGKFSLQLCIPSFVNDFWSVLEP